MVAESYRGFPRLGPLPPEASGYIPHGTRRRILRAICNHPSIKIGDELIRMFYPGTKQPEKKIKTFTRYARQLEINGLIKNVGGLFVATDAGRAENLRLP